CQHDRGGSQQHRRHYYDSSPMTKMRLSLETRMWGNAQGWCLSLVLLGSLIFGMRKLNDLGLMSSPTSFGQDAANLGPVELPAPPSKLLEMNQGIDAKALYRAAIDDYLSNKEIYDRFGRSKQAADAEKLLGLKNLLDATH